MTFYDRKEDANYQKEKYVTESKNLITVQNSCFITSRIIMMNYGVDLTSILLCYLYHNLTY